MPLAITLEVVEVAAVGLERVAGRSALGRQHFQERVDMACRRHQLLTVRGQPANSASKAI